uniref:Uncharacterized protein n=1 Tax=Leersia perrieri TaxID=77586 RepID=A0A0D9XE30_9ORYZ
MGDVKVAAAAAETGMKQIMRLRELLHKWALGATTKGGEDTGDDEAAPAASSPVGNGIPPYVMRRLQRTATVESDDESCCSPEAPADVPRGYCPVYVGHEQRRFVIPTGYLSHPVFRLLLEKAEEEFGFRHEGALAIPCEIETFKYILQCVERHDNGLAPAPADEVEQSAGMEPPSETSTMM